MVLTCLKEDYMIEVYKQIPLYRFLDYCNGHNKGNMILDCGAGGNQPPLSLFYENGYNNGWN